MSIEASKAPHCRRFEGCHDLLALAARWPARYPALLESAADGAGARWDILFAFPGEAIDGDPATFLDRLDSAWLAQRQQSGGDRSLPFRGGWLLFAGYELAAAIEPRLELPQSEGPLPTALALRCPAAMLVDRANACTWLVAENGSADLVDAMARDLIAASGVALPPLPQVVAIDEEPPGRFIDGVARIHDYLRRGDVFQVNLSRGWEARFAAPPRPAALHAALREANPAPFSALLQWHDAAVVSSSPERLVRVRGDRVDTRPIAGTRPRIAGDDDAMRRGELVGNPKERAEHIMLIDLERNDLGRIAVPGSVVVDELMTVESYAHVHHIVSNVSARRRQDVTPGDIVRAVFPGGTITGCPKVRCMEIIAELERVPRGAYTGTIGYLNLDGDMDLNILIRTVTLDGATAAFRAGAGIVADSVAGNELAETRAKARGMLRAMAGT